MTVSFSDSLHVHVHLQTVSANPSVLRGPPIQLDWQVTESFRLSLSQEEQNAMQRFEVSRSTFEKRNVYPRPVARLTSQRRIEILQDNCIAPNVIREFEDRATIGRQEREETIQNTNTRKERRQEKAEEQREKRATQSGTLACCGPAAAAAATTPLSPAEHYLQQWEVAKKSSLSSLDDELLSPTTTHFLHHKSVCKNCSQRAMQLDKACVRMFQCDGKCGGSNSSNEGIIHKMFGSGNERTGTTVGKEELSATTGKEEEEGKGLLLTPTTLCSKPRVS